MSTETKGGQGAFSMIVILVAVIVGMVSFAAFFVLMAFADDLREPEDGGAHALSRSAIGYAGLVTLLKEEGRQVRISRGPAEEAMSLEEFYILSPPPGRALDYDDFYAMWSSNMVVLPKWSTRRQIERPDWVYKTGLLSPETVADTIYSFAEDITIARGPATALINTTTGERIPIGPVQSLQTMTSELLDPILTDEAGGIVVGALIDESDDSYMSFIVSDPDLLNTHGIASLETARAGMVVIGEIIPDDAPIAFDMTLHGITRSRNVLQLLFMPPFLPGTLCLAFAAVLVTIVSFAGNLRAQGQREIPLGKLTLVNNSAQLISLAGRGLNMGARYAGMIRRQAVHALGLSPHSSEAQQVAALDAINRDGDRANEPHFSELASDVTRATKPVAMVKAMNRLYRWKQELGRERRRR